MNRKLEDKLAQLAFGELPPSEARSVAELTDLDAEARKTLLLYKDMKEGLRNLGEVPEDQYSKERLRDAILTQGLRPGKVRQQSPHGWLWMPVAACAFGFGIMFMKGAVGTHNGQPELVIGPAALKEPTVLAFQHPKQAGPVSTSKEVVAKSVVSSTVRHKVHHPLLVASRKVRPNELSPDLLADMTMEWDNSGSIPDASAPSSNGNHSSGAVLASATLNSGPIVMIDQDKDEQTGAQKATEVGNASNVLIGG